MAIDHITPNTAVRGGQQLQILADMGRQFLAQLAAVRAVGVHCQDGATYTTLETVMGLPAGTGADVWFLLDSLYQKVTTDASVTGLASALDNLTARLG